jgi:hypothetical protein
MQKHLGFLSQGDDCISREDKLALDAFYSAKHRPLRLPQACICILFSHEFACIEPKSRTNQSRNLCSHESCDVRPPMDHCHFIATSEPCSLNGAVDDVPGGGWNPWMFVVSRPVPDKPFQRQPPVPAPLLVCLKLFQFECQQDYPVPSEGKALQIGHGLRLRQGLRTALGADVEHRSSSGGHSCDSFSGDRYARRV